MFIYLSGFSLEIAKLKNEAAHLRRAEASIMSFKIALQQLQQSIANKRSHLSKLAAQRTDTYDVDSDLRRLEAVQIRFLNEMTERLLGVAGM
jgi:septal ring factor EnvC (AmiA/AmiB activator)